MGSKNVQSFTCFAITTLTCETIAKKHARCVMTKQWQLQRSQQPSLLQLLVTKVICKKKDESKYRFKFKALFTRSVKNTLRRAFLFFFMYTGNFLLFHENFLSSKFCFKEHKYVQRTKFFTLCENKVLVFNAYNDLNS